MANQQIVFLDAAARESEKNIKEIVTSLYNERNFLRKELQLLRGTRAESVASASILNSNAECIFMELANGLGNTSRPVKAMKSFQKMII